MAKTDKNKLKKAIENQKENRNQSVKFEKKYKLITTKNGKIRDVLFLFGQWVGHRLSNIMKDPQGQNYVFNYVLNPKNNFPTDFKKAVFDVAKRLEADDEFISMKEEDDDIPY